MKQRVKDSNPHIQSQSLLCYPYTNPLFLVALASAGFIIARFRKMSRLFFPIFQKNFSSLSTGKKSIEFRPTNKNIAASAAVCLTAARRY